MFKVHTTTHTFKRFFNSIYQNNFGILFDIDGVLIHGSHGIEGARKMFNMINKSFKSKIPMAFLTNSCDSPEIKSDFLNQMFDINLDKSSIIHAPAPLRLFKDLHNKRMLFVGQGNMKKIGEDLQFTNVVELAHIQEAHPNLDVIDKIKRRALKGGYSIKGIIPIDGVIIVGEPTDWQSYLQIITDLLVTHGDLSSPVDMSSQRLPIYLCNLDFLYKAESTMLRFGNGAFIHSLEMLYKKYTGLDLKYSTVIGKPSEISYFYAEQVLNSINQQINNGAQLERLYMIGDNPASDILGANLYQRFINELDDLPSYRSIPKSIDKFPRSVKSIKSFLVKTGVYDGNNAYCDRHQHWTFNDINPNHLKPTMIVEDCLEAFHRILQLEMIRSEIRN